MTSGCTLLVSWDPQKPCPLVIACNRDDFYDVPIVIPHVWKENPDVLAEKDLRSQGGCWFGVTRSLRWGALSCVREEGDGAALEELRKSGAADDDARMQDYGETYTNSMVARSMMVETFEETEKARAAIHATVKAAVGMTREESPRGGPSTDLLGVKKPTDSVEGIATLSPRGKALKAFDDALKVTYQPPTVFEDSEVKELKPSFTAKTTKGMNTLDIAPSCFGEVLSAYLKDLGNISALVYIQVIAQIGKTPPFSDQLFSLILGDHTGVYFYTNERVDDVVSCLPPGVYTFTAAGTINPTWPKFQGPVGRFIQVVNLEADILFKEGIDKLMELMASTVICDDEKSLPSTGVSVEIEGLLSALFIRQIAGYGTRSTTVVIANATSLQVEHREFVKEKYPSLFPTRVVKDDSGGEPLSPKEKPSEEEESDEPRGGSSKKEEEQFGANEEFDNAETNSNEGEVEEPFLCDPAVYYRVSSIIVARKAVVPDMGMPPHLAVICQPTDLKVPAGITMAQLRKNASKILAPAADSSIRFQRRTSPAGMK